MSFVKIDCGIVNSSLWIERDARSVFMTALIMAEPVELTDPMPQLCTRNLDMTGWVVPPGWYGFVHAAGIGILRCDGIADLEVGYAMLDKLAQPDPDSRSREYDGRRLVRIDGGFIVLNYMAYRERDYTAAERSRRYREKKKGVGPARSVTSRSRDASTPERDVTRNITQAEAEAEAETTTRSTDMVERPALDALLRPTAALTTRSSKPLAARDAIVQRLATVFAEIRTEQVGRMSADVVRRRQAEMLFLYWATRFDHPKALLDKKREAKLVARLKENDGNVSELLYALDGAARDEWIMGLAKDSTKKYDDLLTIFRDRSQVEKFASTRKAYRDGVVHKLIPKLEAALNGDGAVHDGDPPTAETPTS